MSNESFVSCPVSPEKANENIVRIIAIQVIIFSFISLVLNNYLISLFLIFDFALRSFTEGNYSPLKKIGIYFNLFLKLEPIIIPAAPKKFAAGLGVVFSSLISIALIFNWSLISMILGSLLIFCASLEGFFGVCIGCYVYSFLQKLKIISNN
jgi:hypothetical protein